jgi:hypothetical protein
MGTECRLTFQSHENGSAENLNFREEKWLFDADKCYCNRYIAGCRPRRAGKIVKKKKGLAGIMKDAIIGPDFSVLSRKGFHEKSILVMENNDVKSNNRHLRQT